MEKELVDKLLNVGMWDSSYQLPIVEEEAYCNISDAQGSGTVIGRYETNLGGSTGGRIEKYSFVSSEHKWSCISKRETVSLQCINW